MRPLPKSAAPTGPRGGWILLLVVAASFYCHKGDYPTLLHSEGAPGAPAFLTTDRRTDTDGRGQGFRGGATPFLVRCPHRPSPSGLMVPLSVSARARPSVRGFAEGAGPTAINRFSTRTALNAIVRLRRNAKARRGMKGARAGPLRAACAGPREAPILLDTKING